MTASAAQTPTVFLNAAAKETLDNPACRKALAACGYTPEDFGSYKDVREQCGGAREKTKNAKTAGTKGKANPDEDPTAHERWVAEGQSGHISENTRHQAKRGDNDTSFCPLYDTDEAPCMPHGGVAYHKDTQHGAVTNTDIANGNAANQGQEGDRGDRKPIGAAGERKNTRDAMAAALDWGMKDGQPAAAEMRKKRFDAIAELTAKDKDLAPAKKKNGETDEAAVKKNYDANRDTALKCIENFFNAQWRAMAKKTKDDKKAAAASSAADQKAAQAKIDALSKKKPQTAEDKAALTKARADLQAAKDAPGEYKKVEKLDPNDVDKCMGQSRPPNDRTPFGKSSAPPSKKPNKPK